jgi:hypothetical protein
VPRHTIHEYRGTLGYHTLIALGIRTMSEVMKHDRRNFLSSAAMTIATAKLAAIDSVYAQSTKTTPADAMRIKPRTNTSFASLKQRHVGTNLAGALVASSHFTFLDRIRTK